MGLMNKYPTSAVITAIEESIPKSLSILVSQRRGKALLFCVDYCPPGFGRFWE
jgi:hypothetical protein